MLAVANDANREFGGVTVFKVTGGHKAPVRGPLMVAERSMASLWVLDRGYLSLMSAEGEKRASGPRL